MWKMVVCPLCDKVGYSDERTQVGSQYPCTSCYHEFILLHELEA